MEIKITWLHLSILQPQLCLVSASSCTYMVWRCFSTHKFPCSIYPSWYWGVHCLEVSLSSLCNGSIIHAPRHLTWHSLPAFHSCSSTREPAQVFNLLETVYGAFDEIARRRGIFKVETVGDCYVAVCGMPEPRKDHAIGMIRFARDCLARMSSLSQQLEITLGPGKYWSLL